MNTRKLSSILTLLLLTGSAAVAPASANYTYNPSDFATEVISYTPGVGVGTDWISGQPFADPTTALGRPTVDTTGDNFLLGPASMAIPVNPVFAPFRSHELVTVGAGGTLILKFEKPVEDHAANPFGIDLLIYGNSFEQIGGSNSWSNGDPAGTIIQSPGIGYAEPGTVSVSQDGITWHAFTNEGDPNNPGGPYTPYDTSVASHRYADDFAPTLGRVFDDVTPHQPDNDWAWNQWWGDVTDPTLPLDPSLDFSSFGGQTVEQVAQAYGQSAGGTPFDLADVGLSWIQYVRIDNFRGSATATPEIDAVADVAPVGWQLGDIDKDLALTVRDIELMQMHLNDADYDAGYDVTGDGNLEFADIDTWVTDLFGTAKGDANLDSSVDVLDLSILATNYGSIGLWSQGDYNSDGIIDILDLSILATNYGVTTQSISVPEPGMAGVLVVGCLMMIRRCRNDAFSIGNEGRR